MFIIYYLSISDKHIKKRKQYINIGKWKQQIFIVSCANIQPKLNVILKGIMHLKNIKIKQKLECKTKPQVQDDDKHKQSLIDALKEDIQQLKEENKQLKQENKDLKQEKCELNDHISDLINQIYKLNELLNSKTNTIDKTDKTSKDKFKEFETEIKDIDIDVIDQKDKIGITLKQLNQRKNKEKKKQKLL